MGKELINEVECELLKLMKSYIDKWRIYFPEKKEQTRRTKKKEKKNREKRMAFVSYLCDFSLQNYIHLKILIHNLNRHVDRVKTCVRKRKVFASASWVESRKFQEFIWATVSLNLSIIWMSISPELRVAESSNEYHFKGANFSLSFALTLTILFNDL